MALHTSPHSHRSSMRSPERVRARILWSYLFRRVHSLCSSAKSVAQRKTRKKWECCQKRSPDAQNQLFAAVNTRGHRLCPLQGLHTGSRRAGQHDSNIVYQIRTLQTSSPLHSSVSPFYRCLKTLFSVPTQTAPLLKPVAKEDYVNGS